jgi:SAM-dependent methyltransferase
MGTNPLSDIVSTQYERWMYPQPIIDLPGWLNENWQWFDPSHAHRMFWPDREYKPNLDILIAGCGTNQAAVFAYTNPKSKVVAIDVSQPSLDHHKHLKAKYDLNNLELHHLPIEEVGTLNRDFDLIVSTGVLHHLAEPKIGMKALANCLRLEGVIAIMLYAKFGRIGVEMMQSVFKDLSLSQNDASLSMVREALAILPDDHPIKSYLSIAPDLQYDAGLVDTFLHGRDRSYSIDDCFDLVTSADLVFQDLFIKSPYYPPHSSSNPFYSSVAGMPEKKQWSIMERTNFRNGCHFFTACRDDRPKETYKIDFKSGNFANFVPSFRYRCGLNGNKISRYNWSMVLESTEQAILQYVDSHRSIQEILSKASNNSTLSKLSPVELSQFGNALLQRLWQLDFLAISSK